MKSISTFKSKNIDSPKTPGGISKSLLTPCRRVGLSRNWKKSGASPFQAPSASNTEEIQTSVTRKRKESSEEIHNAPENDVEKSSDVSKTPTRIVELPRRKRSKTLLAAINNNQENETEVRASDIQSDVVDRENCSMDTFISTPVKLKSKSKSRQKTSTSSKKSDITDTKENATDIQACSDDLILKETITKSESPMKLKLKSKKKSSPHNSSIKIVQNNCDATVVLNDKHVLHCNKTEETERKSPNNLTKECIVVLQKKIFKKEIQTKEKTDKINDQIANKTKTKSQILFDSDSDDMPLVQLHNNKKEMLDVVRNDRDFANKPEVIKLGKPSKNKSKSPRTIKNNISKVKMEVKPAVQNSDDDDDFVEKKTILIRKSYDKVIKPQKAKSTGSITQKDIDELKARIEKKKKLLLAKAMTDDTKELKDLIKRWQKGCQDALMELMDLMKAKMPDKQNMDYSEILKTLNIPASLVGYDSDNDCFLTPNDEDVVLARFKD